MSTSQPKSNTHFSESEMKIISSMIKYLKGPIDTDWDAVAAEAGLKDGHIAKVRWRQIRNAKITPAVDGGVSSPAKTPTKRKNAENDGDEAPLSKKGKKASGKGKGKQSAESNENPEPVESSAYVEDDEDAKVKGELDEELDMFLNLP